MKPAKIVHDLTAHEIQAAMPSTTVESRAMLETQQQVRTYPQYPWPYLAPASTGSYPTGFYGIPYGPPYGSAPQYPPQMPNVPPPPWVSVPEAKKAH
eukprot:CAMPEP_0170178434 /NCGR_PEP_ID=MMETSP0040_2-20121228/11884_1 /TAXON_ID=641309 /ORGANISM="Lotharella oceanica, Strain CCMP622" /LENGTH=96 /DNA_ID=CAMNT_0010421493 /DNA_START=17 /DNA_END=307 /DNA_ORIENTATION=-